MEDNKAMINYILIGIILVSFVYSMFTGGVDALSGAIMTSGQQAVSLILTIGGAMATWGGIMKLAEASGLTRKLARLLSPLLRLIFKGLKKDSPALDAIAMNITANLFGLGNAATPLGIEAIKRLEEEEGEKDTASRNMALLVVFNTCSIELIPATVASMRAAYQSGSPMEILPCVIIVSVLSLMVSVTAVYLFNGYKGGRGRK